MDSAVAVTAPPGDGDGTISGVVWHDRNGDGVRDPGDSPVPGAVVFLDGNGNGSLDAGEAYTVINRAGEYASQGVDTSAPLKVG